MTVDDIRLLGTPTYEASIFDLLDSLALGRGAAAFAAADELLAAGERTEMLFNRILRNFQNLSRVAAMREEGMSAGGHPDRAQDEALSGAQAHGTSGAAGYRRDSSPLGDPGRDATPA